MRVLSQVLKVVVQIAIVIIVPGGLPAVLVYQYRRLQQRRREAIAFRSDGPKPAPEPVNQETLPESPR